MPRPHRTSPGSTDTVTISSPMSETKTAATSPPSPSMSTSLAMRLRQSPHSGHHMAPARRPGRRIATASSLLHRGAARTRWGAQGDASRGSLRGFPPSALWAYRDLVARPAEDPSPRQLSSVSRLAVSHRRPFLQVSGRPPTAAGHAT